MALDAVLTKAAGCPSGLAPPPEMSAQRADPSAFVRGFPDGETSRLELLVKGANCAGCIKKIERGLLAQPGVRDARLNLSTGRLTIVWTGGSERAVDFVRRLAELGYESVAFDPDSARRQKDEHGRALLRRLAVSGFATMNVMMFTIPVWTAGGEMGPGTKELMHWLAALVALPAAIYSGQPFFASAWAALKRGRANMDVPISIAVLLTLGMSLFETAIGGGHTYFDGVVMLLFLLLIGRYLDHRLRERARTAAGDLLALQATSATRIEADGAPRAIRVRDIAVGDRIALAPGDRVAVDGIILEGTSDLDLSLLTGETAPAPARVGDAVRAGAVNLTRSLIMRAERRAEDSTMAELARLIEIGEQSRARFMRVIDKAAALYVPVVHTLAAATALGWMFGPALLRAAGLAAADVGPHFAITAAAAVLIITCPCALGLAAPAVQVVATGRLFRRGVLVKSGDALERLAQIDTVVLDKTGTLTLGRPRLVGAVDPHALAAAASLARASRHPLARALVEAAGPGVLAANVTEHAGLGLEAEMDGVQARLGRRSFAAPEMIGSVGGGDGQELWFAVENRPPVRFAFEDALRADAAATVSALRARGLAVEILSGDRSVAVQQAARSVGVEGWIAEATPQEKVRRLERLARQGRRVLMVGDGLNDSAALAAAHVSACPGAALDLSQAAADLVLQGADLAPLAEAIDVARAARRRVAENLAFSALYNLVAAPAAILGFVTPLIAALAMSSSSLIVTLNALRLAKETSHGPLDLSRPGRGGDGRDGPRGVSLVARGGTI